MRSSDGALLLVGIRWGVWQRRIACPPRCTRGDERQCDWRLAGRVDVGRDGVWLTA